MSNYYIVEPEVSGGWGEGTEYTRTPGLPVIVDKLHYRFDGWLGDELLESTPCFIATSRLTAEIKRKNLTGVGFDEVVITKSEEFAELFPNRDLPEFVWLKVEGVAGRDDFGLTSHLQLIVSKRALALLESIGISHALVEPFEG